MQHLLDRYILGEYGFFDISAYDAKGARQVGGRARRQGRRPEPFA